MGTYRRSMSALVAARGLGAAATAPEDSSPDRASLRTWMVVAPGRERGCITGIRGRGHYAVPAMMTRRRLSVLFACCLVGLSVPMGLGWSYGARLSTPEGFYPVRVTDVVGEVPGLRRPRRTVLVVFDGLGHEEAEGMRSVARLRAQGQCRKTDVGALSLSRPVYAVLSTGLEVDRTGVRDNDDTSPLAAESVWGVAREAGLSVGAVSELSWWKELFPGGFDAYAMFDQSVDYFKHSTAVDLQIIHPLYIDEAGHEAGAGSAEYQAAVERADSELEEFLGEVDFARDLVVVTADHGHSLSGGHGGRQDRVANVLTCYAGVGVRHEGGTGTLRSTTIAPSLALLLGLRFPATMRAGDDDLDALWDIADPARFPAGYLEQRRNSVERFRVANNAQVEAWMPASGGSWDRFHDGQRQQQLRAAAPLLALMLLVLGLHQDGHRRLKRRTGAGRGGLFGLVFLLGFFAITVALQVALHGSFDLSSITRRAGFILFTVTLGMVWSAGAMLAHLLLRRSLEALLLDLSAVSVVGTVLCLTHPAALGWRMGFPMAPPELYFFPYFAALFLTAFNGVAMLVGMIGWYRTRERSAPASSDRRGDLPREHRGARF